jgi:hypothetical protein
MIDFHSGNEKMQKDCEYNNGKETTTPAAKTGFANVFAASPPKKGGEFL